MASEATGTFVVVCSAVPVAVRVVVVVALVMTGPPSVMAALPDCYGALAVEMLGRHRRLEADGVLGLRQPHLEELGIELAMAAGTRLDGGLGPIEGPSLCEREVREQPGQRHPGLSERHLALRPTLLLALRPREAFVGREEDAPPAPTPER